MNLQDVGRIALQQGLDRDAAYAAMAIAQTEGGLNGAVGDNGHSYGPFQFYSGGQLKNFAAFLQVPMAQAGHVAQEQPEVAVRWALGPGGYLGDTLRNAQRQGLSGRALAEYGQRHAQVSVSPERAAQNYDILFGGGKGSAPQTTAALSGGTDQTAASAPSFADALQQSGLSIGQVGAARSAPAFGDVLSTQGLKPSDVGPARTASRKPVSQFGDPQLTPAEASAACGPAAAIRFAQYFGRNPTLREATDMAKQVGWTSARGMAGLGSEKALMDKLGASTRQVGPDIQAIATEAQTGNPVTISTPNHYFTADGYNPQTGAFHVGQSGLDLKGGSEWMTAAQMQSSMGVIQGALFVDHPQVPTPSTANAAPSPAPVTRAAPPSFADALKQSNLSPDQIGSSPQGRHARDARDWFAPAQTMPFDPATRVQASTMPSTTNADPWSTITPMSNTPSNSGWDSVLDQVDFSAGAGGGEGDADPDLMVHLGGTDAARPQPGEIQQYIDKAARQRGIDPAVAMSVAYNEGGLDEPAKRGTFKTGSSWWPFQLHYGGPGYEQYGNTAGLGNEFTQKTGYQPGDPAAWRAATDYALDTALQRGWYPTFYGSQPAGVSQWQGLPRQAA